MIRKQGRRRGTPYRAGGCMIWVVFYLVCAGSVLGGVLR